jgi:hypothetical protein
VDSRTLDIFLFYGHKFKYAKVNNYGRFIEKYFKKQFISVLQLDSTVTQCK